MATPLLALDAWLSQTSRNTLGTSLGGQPKGSVCVGSALSYRNFMMKFGIGFTQETAEEVSSPLLAYIDLLALPYLLQAYTMCCVVTVCSLYRILNRTSRSAALPYPEPCGALVCIHNYALFLGDRNLVRNIYLSSCPQCGIIGTGISRLNRFVQAPSSKGGSNAPRSSLSVLPLDVNAYRRSARQASKNVVL